MTRSDLKSLIIECVTEVLAESGGVYIITGVVNSDLDVAGMKYTDDSKMVTHGELQSKYGIKGNDWRYRSDINTIMWWGRPDDDERESVEGWLKAKHFVKKPKSLMYGGQQDSIKSLFHYTNPMTAKLSF